MEFKGPFKGGHRDSTGCIYINTYIYIYIHIGFRVLGVLGFRN